MSFIAHIIWFFIKGLRPLLGPAHCKYPVSCTTYAHEQLKTHSVLIAIKKISLRVLSCNPFTS